MGQDRRRGIAAGAATGAVVLLSFLTMAPAGAAPPNRAGAASSITPIVECTAKRGGVNHSVFGYRNSGPNTTISIGQQNRFTPGVPDRGQPTTFASGTHINVFSVTTSASLTWTLDGQQVRAPNVSCQTSPASSSLAGWGPVGAIVIVTALLGSLLFWRSRRLKVRTR
jgi:hypothetical protein